MPEALKLKFFRCGAELPANALGGNRLACLLQLGLAANESVPSTAIPPLREPVQTFKLTFVADRIGEVVGMTIGRHELLEKVGEGGRGVVYVAKQEQPVRRPGCPESDQAGHGNARGHSPLRGRTPGLGYDGPSQYCHAGARPTNGLWNDS